MKEKINIEEEFEFDFGFDDNYEVDTIDYKQNLIDNVKTAEPKKIDKEEYIERQKPKKPKKVKIGKKQLKEDCFFRHETIINIIYFIGNGIIFEPQLYKIINYFNSDKTLKSMKADVKELEELGLIKKTQLEQNRGKYSICLTKYPISKIEHRKTTEVTTIRATRDKQLFSLFRIERFIQMRLENEMANENVTVEDVKNYYTAINDFTLLKKAEDNIIYQCIYNNFKNCGLENRLSFQFMEDLNVSKYDYITKKNNSSKYVIQDIDKEVISDKKDRIQRINTLSIQYSDSYILRTHFNFKNMLSRNFTIEGIDLNNTCDVVTIKLFYTNINKRQDIHTAHRSIGYIYNMFDRYFKDMEIKLDVTYLSWNLNDSNRAKGKSYNKNANNHRIFKNEYVKAGVPTAKLYNIAIGYSSLDLDKKYGIKADY